MENIVPELSKIKKMKNGIYYYKNGKFNVIETKDLPVILDEKDVTLGNVLNKILSNQEKIVENEKTIYQNQELLAKSIKAISENQVLININLKEIKK